MKVQIILIALSLFTSTAAVAQTEGRQKTSQGSDSAAIYATGTASCGAWLDAREGAKNPRDVRHLQFEEFLFGFASAYNWYVGDAPSPRGILGDTDVYADWAFLDKYCRDDPTDSFAKATVALLNHLKSLQRTNGRD